MKRLILSIFLLLALCGNGWAATTFNDTTADHKWSTAANWSDGIPDAADAVTIAGTVTSLNIDTAATVLSIDMTGAAANFVLSGTGALTSAGNITYKASSTTTMTHSGTITITENCTFTSNGMTLGSAITLATASKTLTLADTLNIAAKDITIGAGTLVSGNNTITCGMFYDGATATAKTFTLGSSIINCKRIALTGTNITVTANTATVNLVITATTNLDFGHATWGGTVNIDITDAEAILRDDNTFQNLSVTITSGIAQQSNPAFAVSANTTVAGTLTLTSSDKKFHGKIYSGSYRIGTQITITAATVNYVGGGIDFQDIAGAGAGSWDFSDKPSGNLGGNSGITFRTPAIYYLYCGSLPKQDYDDVFTITDGGEDRTAGGTTVYPLVQDTLIIDNYTWDSTGNSFIFHSVGGRIGTVDASALTEANSIGLPRNAYGDIIYTGSGITVVETTNIESIDARLKNETSDTLDVNITPAIGATNITITSHSGSVRLTDNVTQATGTLTLTKGTLNLNGKTLTTAKVSSTNSNARTIQDTAGSGKIILNGLTGTLFDTTTATNLTVSNAPAIQIGDGTKTLTGNVTFMGAGKTYGNFTVSKHAGDFDAIITGANTFGTLTLGTPDATYQYSDLQLPASTTTTVTSLAGTGTALYKPKLISSTGGTPATISDTAGVNTVTYFSIQDITATGGATFKAKKSTNVSGNTGLSFMGGGFFF